MFFFQRALHDPVLRSRRRERRLRAVGRRARRLDVGVRGRLVVVQDDQQVVVGLERARHAGQPHVAAAQVAGEVDHVDLLLLDLALAHQRAQTGGHADGRRAARAELRVHPGNDPGRRLVAGVRDVHAPGRAGDHRARAGRLREIAHDERRLAPLTRAMARGVELLERRVLDLLDVLVLDDGQMRSHSVYSRNPIHVTLTSSDPLSAACRVRSNILMQSSIEMSRPPRPPMKFDMTGRRVSG